MNCIVFISALPQPSCHQPVALLPGQARASDPFCVSGVMDQTDILLNYNSIWGSESGEMGVKYINSPFLEVFGNNYQGP